MSRRVLCIAGSPRRGGNSEQLLDRAIAGCREADPQAQLTKLILNEMDLTACQNCGFCTREGVCRIKDDMQHVYPALAECDRFVIATPIYFATVSAQTKTMIDRCQAMWAKKYLLKSRHPNPDREALLLSCGGFKHDRFFRCAKQVIEAWCVTLDIKLSGALFYPGVDALGEIAKHPSALDEAFAAGRELVS